MTSRCGPSLVATLVATVVTTSSWVGPKVSGMIALFPIVFTSMMLILHPRIGGPPTAAVLANSAWGLIGLGIAIAVLHVAALQFGSAIGLSLALATCVGWNLGLWWLGRRKVAARQDRKFDGYRRRGDPLSCATGQNRARAVEGLYKVEYDISGGTGRSVLYAHAGTMLGGNTAFAHFGTYDDVDGEIVARLRTRRHSPSPHGAEAGQRRRSHHQHSRQAAGRRLALLGQRRGRRRLGVSRGHDAAR